ncbi:MAG: thioredoxin domain-containing protein [Chitinophagaceae bacterium]
MKSLKCIITFIFFFQSCTQNRPEYAGLVNHIPIKKEEVDKLIEQELYQTLQRVYVLRKTATEEIIYQKLLETEAKERNITRDELVETEITQKVNENNIQQFIKDQKLEARGIPTLNNGYRLVGIHTAEGEQLVIEEYKKFLNSNLFESLKTRFPVEIYIQPPSPPKVFVNNAPILRFSGKKEATVTFIEVSDMECDNCRKSYPIFKALYNKYNDKVKFGFTHFSGNVTLAATATEAAARQNKFLEMQEVIMSTPPLQSSDTAGYCKLGERIGLDRILFAKDVRDITIYNEIKKNIDYLRANHLYATPTIIVNGTVIMDAFDQEALEKLIEKALNKKG